jgi:hypothetical protein
MNKALQACDNLLHNIKASLQHESHDEADHPA